MKPLEQKGQAGTALSL